MTDILFAAMLGLGPRTMPAPEPIDAQIAQIKPGDGETSAQARAKCKELTRQAKTRGARTLLMGFEGQGGFAADNTLLVYRYLWRITHGTADVPPVLDNRAPVQHRLLLPLIDHYKAKIEILDYAETSISRADGGVPAICAAEWMSVAGNRLVLMGHSFGADAAADLANHLDRAGVKITQIYTMDMRPRIRGTHYYKPANVQLWINFFQRNEPTQGWPVNGGDTNTDLSSHGVNHRTIVRSPPVIAEIQSRLKIP